MTNELRTKFEAWFSEGSGEHLDWMDHAEAYNDYTHDAMWQAFQAAHTSRDAEVEAMLASVRVPDGWQPTDAEVMAWMERSDIDNRSVSDMRTAIDDARSMHMLAAAPKRGEG